MEKPETSELEKTRLDIFKTIAQCNSDIVKKLEGINNSNGVYVGSNSYLTISGDFNMRQPFTSSSDTSTNNSATPYTFTTNCNPAKTIVLPKTKPVKTKKRKK
jgi:hypothetical protein